ncbi:MAG: glycosyltransferase [Clostridium lundense]|nr:glycosyltransferase [Clostridium lundense]
MKICLINTYYYPDIVGGTEVSVKKLAEGLADLGHEINVICTGKSNEIENINGIRVNRIKIKNIYSPIEHKRASKLKKITYRALDINNVFNKKILKDKIESIKPDIIHINNIYGLSISLWDVLRKFKIPIIHTLRDYYLICPKVNLLKKGQICNKPNFACKLYSKYNKRVFNIDTCVTAPSKFTLKLFDNLGYLKEIDNTVIYNAIDFVQEDVNKILNEKKIRNDEKIKFVYLGGLEQHKGITWLLNSFKEVNNENIELNIAGQGVLKQLVLDATKKDKRIKYHGFLKEAELNKLLNNSDVLVVPSIWYEPFGRVVIDAYKNVMPVIVSDIGGISEIIDNSKTGILVTPNSNEELVSAIDYFTDRENIISKLDNCAHKLKDYSIHKQVKEFENLYYKYISN